MLTAFSHRDLQNFRAIQAVFATAGITDPARMDAEIDAIMTSRAGAVSRSDRRHPDNVTTCSICGKSAVIVPLSAKDRSATATHAVVCNNRPAKDQPWCDGMCGHTEYIVQGERR